MTVPRILIIEDNDYERMGIAAMLDEAGHDVSAVSSGKLALQSLRERPVEVVITDMVMPDMDGVETIVALRYKYPDVKVIAVSDGGIVSPEHYLRLAKNLGADRVLRKPFSSDEILAAIESVLAIRSGTRN